MDLPKFFQDQVSSMPDNRMAYINVSEKIPIANTKFVKDYVSAVDFVTLLRDPACGSSQDKQLWDRGFFAN